VTSATRERANERTTVAFIDFLGYADAAAISQSGWLPRGFSCCTRNSVIVLLLLLLLRSVAERRRFLSAVVR
jgi:hypothetical protein